MYIAGWENFFLAEVGASAALVGLLFVGVSINLAKILSFSKLPSRAFVALLLLMTVLLNSSLLLVPQPMYLAGIEIIVIGLVMWVTILTRDLKIWKETGSEHRLSFSSLVAIDQIALLFYVIAGIMLAFGNSAGMYWLVPAIILSTVKALMDAWVLLIEINR